MSAIGIKNNMGIVAKGTLIVVKRGAKVSEEHWGKIYNVIKDTPYVVYVKTGKRGKLMLSKGNGQFKLEFEIFDEKIHKKKREKPKKKIDYRNLQKHNVTFEKIVTAFKYKNVNSFTQSSASQWLLEGLDEILKDI